MLIASLEAKLLTFGIINLCPVKKSDKAGQDNAVTE